MKVIFNKDGTGSIIWGSEDWLAGFDTTSAGGIYGKMGGNPSMSEIDPLRSYGYVSPGFNGVAVTNNSQITSQIRNGVVKGDNAFLVTSGALTGGTGTAQVLKLGSLTTTEILSAVAPFPHTIDHAHTNESGDDIVNYYNGTPHTCSFYSFTDATDWDVGIYDHDADSFDDDFMSTVPTNPLGSPYLTGGQGFPHPLVRGDDDVLYMGDRNFLHAYDWSTNTFYPAVLTLPKGWIITCFTTTEDLRLAIGTYYVAGQGTGNTYNRGSSRVWFWNYLALDPDYSRDLRDNYVSEIIQWSGSIAAFTSGRKTLSDLGAYKLQVLNGAQFEVVKTWSAGGLPIRGGVDNVGNDLYWNGAGQLYSYTKRPDNGKFILNNITAVGSTSGMVKFFTATSTYNVSFGTTTSGLIYYVNNYNDSGTLRCQVSTPDWPTQQKGSLTGISIKFKTTFSGGRTLSIAAKVDESTGITLISDFQNSTKDRIIQLLTRSDGTPLGTFSSLQPIFTWADNGSGSNRELDCPVVEEIRFDFRLVNA